MRGILLLCAGLATGTTLAAQQSPRYRVDRWSSDDGLPSNFISDLTQSRDGFLWLAAGGNLVRFDGFSFRVFSPATDSALTGRVNTLYAGTGDSIWLALDDGSVASYSDGHIARLGARISSTVLGLSQDRSGALVTTGTQFHRWENGRFVQLAEQPDATFWGPLVVHYRSRGLTLTTRRAGPLLEVVDRTGVVFAAIRWSQHLRPWLIDRMGRLWAGDRNRLLIFLPGAAEPDEIIALGAENTVARAMEDRDGNIWLAGMGLLRVQEVPFRTVVRDARLTGLLAQVEQLSPGPRGTVLARMWNNLPASLYRLTDSGGVLVQTGYVYGAADRRGTIWLARLEQGASVVGRPEQGPEILLPRPGRLVLADDPARPGSVWLHGSGWLFRAEPYAPGGPRIVDSVAVPGDFGQATVARDGALLLFMEDSLRRHTLVRVDGRRVTSWSVEHGLPRAKLRALYADQDGCAWLGTYGGGLVRLKDGRFQAILERDGLGEDVVTSIIEDSAGNLWMGGNRGVHRVSRADAEAFLDGRLARVQGFAYGRAQGLTDPETSGLPGTRSDDGRFWFPTFGGAAVVDPVRAIALDSAPPLVHVLDMGIAGQQTPARNGLRLRRGQRRLAIEYTGISLRDPAGVRFSYRMDGVDRDWVYAGNTRVAVYNNIGPGDHTFRVRAMNRGGVWSHQEATVAFTVPARFYETIPFYLLVAFLSLAGVRQAHLYRTRQLRARQEELRVLVAERTDDLGRALARVEAQAEQLRSLDEAKSRFFANVSHEFRTPLSLVLGPLEDLLDGRAGALPDTARKRLDTVLSNGRRLVQLVEQLLDVARLESGTLHLKAEVRDLVPLLRRISESFASLAEHRGLGFRVACPVGGLRVRFDEDQMEKIVGNLLANALKFTPAGGRVELRAQVLSENGAGQWAVIEVEDTGPGIPAEHLSRVFDRFFQVDDSPQRAHGGVGIGLALASELVDLHGGTITVASTPGSGSTFTVRLPISSEASRSEDAGTAQERLTITGEQPAAATAGCIPDRATPQPDVTTVVVAEDNAELLEYLREHLADSYRVLEATNGRVALELIREHVPDLVISDVMMPELDGQAMCARLKRDPETDFIPVILLTAKASRESRLAGLEGGADDYLAKPVDMRELLVRAANLIDSRRKLRERYAAVNRELPSVKLPLQPGKWGDRSDTLLQNLYKAMAEHVGDESFQVDQLAAAVGMGRSTLYRRLEELLGRSPMDVFWDYRLEQAAQWLLETDANVSEIAYGVGFKSVPHFCARFRERFGRTPSSYRAKPAT